MTRWVVVSLAAVVVYAPPVSAQVTFNKDVLPILQRKCQTCHRPGEIGPMALMTYQGSRPWARAIKTAVATKATPPWFAEPRYGHFANDTSSWIATSIHKRAALGRHWQRVRRAP